MQTLTGLTAQSSMSLPLSPTLPAASQPAPSPQDLVQPSSVTATESAKTMKEAQNISDDDTNDLSGESLGIRARRDSSPAFDGAPDALNPDRPATSNTSKATAGSARETSSDGARPFHDGVQPAGPLTMSSLLAHSTRRLTQSGTEAGHVQPTSQDPQGTASSASSAKAIPPYIPPHRAAALTSPPPPSVGASFGKTGSGDYYSIPSPKLDPIDELTEDGSRIGMHVHIETPLKDLYSRSLASLVGRRPTPYAATQLRETNSNTSASSGSPSATFSISTPGTKSRSSNESVFNSPSIAPLIHEGSPIRFIQRFSQATLAPNLTFPPNPTNENSAHAALAARRPGALQIEAVLSPLRKQEAKIRDILWQSPAREEEEEAAEADILPPELEQLGQPTAFSDDIIKSCMPPDIRHESRGLPPPTENNKHVQTGPEFNQKIPTLVGPNSLPYARCPSGVDSFAFDLQAPRPYDIVMPPRSSTNVHLQASSAPVRDIMSESASGAGSHANDDQPSPSPAFNVPSKTNLTSASGASTHNERARQRMERVKSATMRREQARIEEQGRKELARIVKRLNQEQDERHSRAVGAYTLDEAFVPGDVSTATIVGEDLLKWQYDAEVGWTRQASPEAPKKAALKMQGTPSGKQLNSGALPFLPRTGNLAGGKTVALEGIPLVHPAYTFPPQSHTAYPHVGYTQQHVDPSAAEVTKTQNRLLHILQQRAQNQPASPQMSLDSLLQQQSAMIAALQNTSSYMQGGMAPSSPLTAAPNLGVLSAIQTMMQTNQQLISMLQDTERVLAGNSSPMYMWPLAMPPVSPVTAEQAITRFPPGLDVLQSVEQVYATPAASPAAPYLFPSKAIPIQKPASLSQQTASQLSLQRSISDDPAVVHSYRRKSVTFEDQVLNADSSAAFCSAATREEVPVLHQAASPPYVPPALRPGGWAAHREHHSLPPRPTFPDISAKAMGIVPHAADSPKMTTKVATEKPKFSESLSTVTNSERQYRRADRSSAPSPELSNGPKQDAAFSKATKLNASRNDHKKERLALREKSGNISTGSASRECRNAKQDKAQKTGSAKEKVRARVPASATEKYNGAAPTRRDKTPNDDLWSNFVQQMGGMIPQSTDR